MRLTSKFRSISLQTFTFFGSGRFLSYKLRLKFVLLGEHYQGSEFFAFSKNEFHQVLQPYGYSTVLINLYSYWDQVAFGAS